MPFALIIAGAILLTASVRNTQGDLFNLLKADFTGQNNFIFWMISILAVGAVGYIPKLKPISNAFLVLIVVVLFLHNRGFFAQFKNQISTTTTDTNVGNSSSPLSSLKIPQLPGLPVSF